MPFCTNCGKEVMQGQKFCGRCGRPLARLSPTSPGQGASPSEDFALATGTKPGAVETGKMRQTKAGPRSIGHFIVFAVIGGIIAVSGYAFVSAGSGYEFGCSAGQQPCTLAPPFPWLMQLGWDIMAFGAIVMLVSVGLLVVSLSRRGAAEFTG